MCGSEEDGAEQHKIRGEGEERSKTLRQKERKGERKCDEEKKG